MAGKISEGIADWEKKAESLELLLVNSQQQICREQLDLILVPSIPRSLTSRFAQIANRAENSILALKILYKHIHTKNLKQLATAQEKLIYVHALLNLGAIDEAHAILDTIDSKAEHEVLFHKALAYFGQWDYSKSIPLLKSYLQSKTLNPYRRLIAEVNLAAAYVAEFSWILALAKLEKIEEDCKVGNYLLLLGNILELKAQVYFFQKNYDQALIYLNQSREILKDQKGIYLFYVEKWIVFCHMFKSKDISALAQLREQSRDSNYFETLRECDLFEALIEQDETLIRKVIMGTPSEPYRRRVRHLFHRTVKMQGQFNLQLGPATSDSVSLFDPFSGTDRQIILAENPQLLALYQALTLDFYRPSYLGYLFTSVYPDEKFNPTTSPPRVLQLLKRLDRWFKDQNVPLYIRFKKSEFSLGSNRNINIAIHRGQKISLDTKKWSEIRAKAGHRAFSTLEVAKILKISKASSQRLIQKALLEKKIKCVGSGARTSYQFIMKNKP